MWKNCLPLKDSIDEMLPAPLEKSGNSQGIWFGMESGYPLCTVVDFTRQQEFRFRTCSFLTMRNATLRPFQSSVSMICIVYVFVQFLCVYSLTRLWKNKQRKSRCGCVTVLTNEATGVYNEYTLVMEVYCSNCGKFDWQMGRSSEVFWCSSVQGGPKGEAILTADVFKKL